MAISKEVEEEIIYLFFNTKLEPFEIFKKVIGDEDEKRIEEFYNFLENYRNEDGSKLSRNYKEIDARINEQIYQLRVNLCNPRQISEILEKKCIELSPSAVNTRCKKIFKEKGEVMPKTRIKKKEKKETNLRDLVLEIGRKRKATKEQLETFAKKVSEYYGENIDILRDVEVPYESNNKEKNVSEKEERDGR